MADGHRTRSQFFHSTLVENILDQSQIFAAPDCPVAVDGDAGRFLSPVLQGCQSGVGELGHIGLLRHTDAEDTAFFMYL